MYLTTVKSTFVLLFTIFSFLGYSQLTITLTSIPINTPSDAPIYIVGSFNNWNPSDNQYLLTKNPNNTYQITFTPPIGIIKFKFTQGSWSSVEGTSSGGFVNDRSYNYTGGTIGISLSILGWEGKTNQPSTASPNVTVLSDTFYIPQLNKKRRIWVYTPPNYSTSNDSFQVLYMHDGQNLFDNRTSFSGEWGVDEALDSLCKAGHKGSIIVGIDNGGGSRLDEYSPWVNPQYGGGQGDLYIDFITKTLMPAINAKYRTLSGPDHTGIMGSSMGGLISMYAGLKYPQIFGKVGAFSSSFWFSGQSFIQPSTVTISADQLHYLIAGAKEGGNQIGDMQKIVNALLKYGVPTENLVSKSHADANHSEWYWKREFPNAYKFLFEKKASKVNDLNPYQTILITQKGSDICIDNINDKNASIHFYQLNGQHISSRLLGKDLLVPIDHTLSSGGLVIIKVLSKLTQTTKIHFVTPF